MDGFSASAHHQVHGLGRGRVVAQIENGRARGRRRVAAIRAEVFLVLPVQVRDVVGHVREFVVECVAIELPGAEPACRGGGLALAPAVARPGGEGRRVRLELVVLPRVVLGDGERAVGSLGVELTQTAQERLARKGVVRLEELQGADNAAVRRGELLLAVGALGRRLLGGRIVVLDPDGRKLLRRARLQGALWVQFGHVVEGGAQQVAAERPVVRVAAAMETDKAAELGVVARRGVAV